MRMLFRPERYMGILCKLVLAELKTASNTPWVGFKNWSWFQICRVESRVVRSAGFWLKRFGNPYLADLVEAVSKLEGNDVVQHERDTTPKTQKNHETPKVLYAMRNRLARFELSGLAWELCPKKWTGCRYVTKRPWWYPRRSPIRPPIPLHCWMKMCNQPCPVFEGCTHTHTHTHTLAQKHLCEFRCGTHRTCKNTSFKPDRRHRMTGSEKQCEVNLSKSLLDGSNRSDGAQSSFIDRK